MLSRRQSFYRSGIYLSDPAPEGIQLEVNLGITGTTPDGNPLLANTALLPLADVPEGFQSEILIDWGDGSVDKVVRDHTALDYPTHTYSESGIYDITFSPSKDNLQSDTGYFGFDSSEITAQEIQAGKEFIGDYRNRFTKIKSWGKNNKPNFLTFRGCQNLDCVAQNIPDLSAITNLDEMFRNCPSLVGNQFFNFWNTSNITSMMGMFRECDLFDSPIGNWDMSGVTNISSMFSGWVSGPLKPTKFNQDIGSWNTSNVTTLASTFFRNEHFNQDISNWDTSNVTNMNFTFSKAKVFNQPLNTWDTSNVTTMDRMFEGRGGSGSNRSQFDQPLNNWDTSNVVNMFRMFVTADNFNQNINTWNTANVTNMGGMFDDATTFNQPLDNWNTSNVTNMSAMFSDAKDFDQDISSWDTSNVTDMSRMFDMFNFVNVCVFNQDIGAWNTGNVTNMDRMFQGTRLFNQDLKGWCVANITTQPLDFGRESALETTNYPFWSSCPGGEVPTTTFLYPMRNTLQDITNTTWRSFAVSSFNYQFVANVGIITDTPITNMSGMFARSDFDAINNPVAFNEEDLQFWDTSTVTDMSEMFRANINFDENISSWNTANVTDMSYMFAGVGGRTTFDHKFNQDIGAWNTGNVTNMDHMFNNAGPFNQDISNWNTANVTNMDNMFEDTDSFNQNLGGWCVEQIPSEPPLFSAGNGVWTQPKPNWGAPC